MTPLLRLVDIRMSYDGVHALKGVSFDLFAGEVHAIVGENGAGKSTLIKVVTGAIQPDSGTVEVGGMIVEGLDPARSRTLGIAAIYQQPALFPDLTVAENVALGLESAGPWRRVRWRDRRQQARRLLDLIGAEIDPDTEVRRLSMPEQQSVEIARALGADARILILDEPTASLGEAEVARLFRAVRGIKARGVGLVYISHRLDELAEVADRVTALRDGEAVATRTMAAVSRSDLIRLMVGRDLSEIFPKAEATVGDVVLEAQGLGCRATGVRGIDVTLKSGEILGMAGLVGAGRTEIARVLFGLTPSDSGTIRFDGKVVSIGSPGAAVAIGIGYVPEDRRRHGVIPEMSVAANATLATLQSVSKLGLIDSAREHRAASDLARQLGVKTPTVDTPVGDLSGGNQQKVALARWMATSPRILILDEPTQGVDVGAKAEIHRLMGDLARQGMAILLISSELPEILAMSDRIAVVRGGTIVARLDRSDASPEAILDLALGHPAPRGVAS